MSLVRTIVPTSVSAAPGTQRVWAEPCRPETPQETWETNEFEKWYNFHVEATIRRLDAGMTKKMMD